MCKSEVENIIQIIHESFRDAVPPPSDDPIIWSHPDYEPFMDMIQGKTWEDFLEVLESSDEGMNYGNMFYFMTDSAFHYLAPALLIVTIKGEADVLGGAFLTNLVPYGPQAIRESIEQQLALFSKKEKHAIALVVDYVYRTNGIFLEREAELVDYWKRWLY